MIPKQLQISYKADTPNMLYMVVASRQYIPKPIFIDLFSISSTEKNTSMTFFNSKTLRTFTINTMIGL